MFPKKLLLALAGIACTHTALAADPNAGKTFFRAQCGLCHSAEPNDNGGAQGPSLQGIFGREAAASGNFSYTEALQQSHLNWNAENLDHFLAAPTEAVAGTAMVVPVPGAEDRANVIAYFQALSDGTFKEPESRAGGPGGGGFGPPPAATPPVGEADWKKDAP